MNQTKKKPTEGIKTRPAGKLHLPGSAIERVGREPDGAQMSEILFGTGQQAQSAESPALPLPPPTTSYHPPPPNASVAPTKDFARVANSVTRDAVPAGLFRGTSKKTYDALYLRTRGAVVPVREVRARMSELMGWCGVSHNTLREHLRHLEAVGLLRRKWELGNNDGALYEVMIPEELAPSSYHLLPPPTTSRQNLGGGTSQELGGGGGGQTAESATVYGEPKTFIKTIEKIDDDEPFGPLLAAARELTGRELTGEERARFRDVAELLATELKIAAGRTAVSNVPAFLTEHLRRRLWKKNASQVVREVKGTSEGKSEPVAAPSECPDCFGTGMYYPEGFDKGVARCGHDKLKAE